MKNIEVPVSGAVSLFSGLWVCEQAGLPLRRGAAGPCYDDDIWDFCNVLGLPVSWGPEEVELDFGIIDNPAWRPLVKAYIFARLVPNHPLVLELPLAYRTPLGIRSCKGKLRLMAKWLNWLTELGVDSLASVSDSECDGFKIESGKVRHRKTKKVLRNSSDSKLRRSISVVIELSYYTELFAPDGYAVGYRPWKGQTASAVVGGAPWRGQNRTEEVPDEILRPLVAAAMYVVQQLAPRIRQLCQESERPSPTRRPRRAPVAEFATLLSGHVSTGSPLPRLTDSRVVIRLSEGWAPDDPLLYVSLNQLSLDAGFKQPRPSWLEALRPQLEEAVALVGTAYTHGRDAELIPRADDQGEVPWTEPVSGFGLSVQLVMVARAAALILVAAVTGMRLCELMELKRGCCLEPDEYGEGQMRYRVAGKLIKGQKLGGVRDEWVVIKDVWDALQTAETLIPADEHGGGIFGRFTFNQWSEQFRDWVNSSAGQRLGLEPIPEGTVNLRMLRRTLAVEMAYRPYGLMAAKFALKHVSAVTTEGYTRRPGGAQAKFLAEVQELEEERNVEILQEEYENYRNNIMPAGPGAAQLVKFFEQIDEVLKEHASQDTNVIRNDDEILALMRKRAGILHVGLANYCWFADPSRALCLIMAGLTDLDQPLMGMCDSGRCSQATHGPRHRPVWAEHERTQKIFIGELGVTRKLEGPRQQDELQRAQRILAEIDAAMAGAGAGV